MRVAKDVVVTLEYEARLDDGTVVDSTHECGPVTYLHGNEQIFPALERAVDGLEAGAVADLHLSAAESYGERRPELERRMPRAQLPPGLSPVVGERYGVKAPDGRRLAFRVVAVEDDEVIADFNSPAAGQGLHLTAKVLAVRAATAEELRRGSVR
jgi:FKBP-type peptidyl-prolyl cis-trans isomerase SlyD